MTNYRDYVSFDAPGWMIDRGVNLETVQLDGALRQRVEQALEEIASTPEGAKLLEVVAEKYPDGKINIISKEGGGTFALAPNDIQIGSMDDGFQYYSHETSKFHDMSLQRMLVHELEHLASAHEHKRGDENEFGISPTEEAEAVNSANAFMSKYYGEVPRSEDTTIGRLHGSSGWDYNEDFKDKPELLRSKLSELTIPDIGSFGSQLQSLLEHRGDRSGFEERYREMEASGDLENTLQELDGIMNKSLNETKPISRFHSDSKEEMSLSTTPRNKPFSPE